MGLNGFIFKKINENIIEKLKSWEPFRSCLLNSTANPAQFGWKLAGLVVLFSRQLLNGSQDFFSCFDTLIFIYFFKYETIFLYVLQFFLLIFFCLDSVKNLARKSAICLEYTHFKNHKTRNVKKRYAWLQFLLSNRYFLVVGK